MRISAQERFMRYVKRTTHGLTWIGGKCSDGYGNFYQGGRYVGAHIASFRFFVDSIPNGAWVLHRCDIPACVEPSHLYVGGPKENARDMVERGRVQRWKRAEPLCASGHNDWRISRDPRGRKSNFASLRRHCRECRRIRDRRYYGS